MCDENHYVHTQDINYYLKNIHNITIMSELMRVNRRLYDLVQRLNYIHQCMNHEPIYKCPECDNHIITDEWGEEYCSVCGLITRSHHNYVAGQRVTLPFGLK